MTEEDEDLKPRRNCSQKTKMFICYAAQDVGRNKLNFSLAFGSVFIVVLSILLVDTIVTMGPLIFLGLGQKSNGEIDAVFSPPNPGIYSTGDTEDFWANGTYLNWTQISTLNQEQHNLAPRRQIWASGFNSVNELPYQGR